MSINVKELLGNEAETLLSYRAKVPAERLLLPGPDYVDRAYGLSDRPTPVLRNLQALFDHGRLAGTGYLSILPVDQGIEHSAGASFAPNPDYFDPENIVQAGHRGRLQRRGLHLRRAGLGGAQVRAQDPLHREVQPQRVPHLPEQVRPDHCSAPIKQAWDMGAVAVGATIYFGSAESSRQIVEVSQAFKTAHELGMATILWCYTRNNAFKKDKDYHVSADLTGQANHLGVTIEADIIKQKLPVNNGGFKAISSKENPYGKTDERIYTELSTRSPDRPVPLPGAELLRRPDGSDQQRRRIQGRQRPGRRGQDRGHQQARGRHGPDLGPQGLPAPPQGGRRAAAGDPGRLPGQVGHHRLSDHNRPGWMVPTSPG